jgi:hypothetical protein
MGSGWIGMNWDERRGAEGWRAKQAIADIARHRRDRVIWRSGDREIGKRSAFSTGPLAFGQDQRPDAMSAYESKVRGEQRSQQSQRNGNRKGDWDDEYGEARAAEKVVD